MEEFLSLIDPSFLSELLSDSGKASLAEKLLIVGAVWIVMGRKVAGHFNAIESGMRNGFAELTKSVNDVRTALTQVENAHSNKLDSLSKRVEVIEDRISEAPKS